LKVFYVGRYNTGETLTGPEKAAKRVFNNYCKDDEAVFIEYFFDGRKYGIMKKLFGRETVNDNRRCLVLRLGLLPMLLYLFKHKPSTIHIITFERFAVMSFIYKVFGNVKIVCGFQGNVHFENITYKNVGAIYKLKDYLCEKIMLKFSDRIFFLSEHSADISCRFHKFDRTKIEIIPNGIDEVFNTFGKLKAFTTDEVLKIVFIGNVDRREKGFDFLKRVLERISFSYKLYLLSNDKKFDNSGFITFPQMDTYTLAQFLSDKDVYISASEYEPFSIAAAETMAEGLIPVVTDMTGMSRYVTDGTDGYIFESGDEEKLTAILNKLSQSRNLLPEISKRSILIYEKLCWKNIVSQYRKYYS